MNNAREHFLGPRLDLIAASIGLLVGAAIIGLLQQRAPSDEVKYLRMIPPPKNIQQFSFGYRDTMADLLWVRVIQDIDICENVKGGIAHVKGVVRNGPACKQGWVYQMLDAITTLAPAWKLPYKAGSLLLSVAVDDIAGATLIFEKGIARFPTDYNLLYNAGYHYIWEEKNPKRAAEVLLMAAKNGGPNWFYSLAGKMYSQAGQAELAKGALENALRDMPEGTKGRERIEQRLNEVNQMLQSPAKKE